MTDNKAARGKKGHPLGQEMMQKATERKHQRGHLLVAAPSFS